VAGLIAMNIVLGAWYFAWLLSPAHAGTPWVYGLLVTVELFNLVQAAGFWWTVPSRPATPRPSIRAIPNQRVDVLIPTINEPIDVVEPTVQAATRLEGADITVWLLDDGDRPEMAAMAAHHGVRYITRREHGGAKAGNLNHALRLTDAPFVAVFDCDQVPAPGFLVETLRRLVDGRVAFVQTPQYYVNRDAGHIAAAAATQQDLFFGTVAPGKDAKGAMFCCGTNVLLRRRALEDVGDFPTHSLTEDFEMSIRLHERGWTSVYVPTVLAHGLGPEDMSSYAGQQSRWAQGCLSAVPRILRSRVPLRLRAQYLLAASYFLSGWAVLVYMSLPVLRLLFHVTPIRPGAAPEFLAHFLPYFTSCILTVVVASAGTCTFAACSLAIANFGVLIGASLRVLFRRSQGFVVTSKHAIGGRHWRSVVPPLVAISVLAGSAIYGLAVAPSDSSLTNATFAAIWIAVLLAGTWSAVFVNHRPAGHGPRPPTAPVRTAAWSGDVALEEFATTVSLAALLGPALPSSLVDAPAVRSKVGHRAHRLVPSSPVAADRIS
jgi:cellulose synthase (UDP-forming)